MCIHGLCMYIYYRVCIYIYVFLYSIYLYKSSARAYVYLYVSFICTNMYACVQYSHIVSIVYMLPRSIDGLGIAIP